MPGPHDPNQSGNPHQEGIVVERHHAVPIALEQRRRRQAAVAIDQTLFAEILARIKRSHYCSV